MFLSTFLPVDLLLCHVDFAPLLLVAPDTSYITVATPYPSDADPYPSDADPYHTCAWPVVSSGSGKVSGLSGEGGEYSRLCAGGSESEAQEIWLPGRECLATAA